MELKDQIIDQLRNVYDPELGVNVVDLGLIYDVLFEEEGHVHVRMTLTTPGCPMHNTISGGVESALRYLPEVKSVQVEVVWAPPWTPDRMSEEAKEHLGYF